jgi:hypothetical protein
VEDTFPVLIRIMLKPPPGSGAGSRGGGACGKICGYQSKNVPLFAKYKLHGAKRQDFNDFQKVVTLMVIKIIKKKIKRLNEIKRLNQI